MEWRTGDIIFDMHQSKGIVDDAIRFFTFGPVSHVALVYSSKHVFETHIGKGAHFGLLKTYAHKRIQVFRLPELTAEHRKVIQSWCHVMNGTPYSLWDVTVHGLTFWLHPRIRGKIMTWLGTKKFMKCDELVQFILYKVTGYPVLKHYEARNPSQLWDLMCRYPDLFQRVL
jgi:hypothetical protein